MWLSTRSEEFAPGGPHRTCATTAPASSTSTTPTWETAPDVRGDGPPGLSLVTYSAEPGSPSQDGVDLLASWAATLDQTEQAGTAAYPSG